MLTGAILSVLLLTAVVGTVVYFRRQIAKRRFDAECAKIQRDAELKQIRDREAIQAIREKLKHELPLADPNLIVHHIDLDEEGRNLVERLVGEMPAAPEPQLYSADLKPVACPDFYAYKIPDTAADAA